jgi:Domain of unknown function (DUF6457)
MLEEWVAELSAALDITDETDVKKLLDVARVVAHKIDRRAAPVTTYLMGVAVARGPEGTSLEEISKQVVALARRWEGTAPEPRPESPR